MTWRTFTREYSWNSHGLMKWTTFGSDPKFFCWWAFFFTFFSPKIQPSLWAFKFLKKIPIPSYGKIPFLISPFFLFYFFCLKFSLSFLLFRYFFLSPPFFNHHNICFIDKFEHQFCFFFFPSYFQPSYQSCPILSILINCDRIF